MTTEEEITTDAPTTTEVMSTDQPTSEELSTTEEIVSESTTLEPTTEEDTTPVYTTTNPETTEENTDTSTESPETTTGKNSLNFESSNLNNRISKSILYRLIYSSIVSYGLGPDPVSPCDNFICYNGGYCREDPRLPEGAECVCPKEYDGDYCQYGKVYCQTYLLFHDY